MSSTYGQEALPQKADIRTYGNSVKFQFGDFYIPGTIHTGKPISQLGLYYERKLFKKFHAGIGYMQWTPIRSPSIPILSTVKPESEYEQPVVGGLEFWRKYKMLDLYLTYKYSIAGSHHLVSPNIGISYAWGIDQYLQWHYYYFFEEHSGYEWRKNSYYGLISGISYDYLLLNNRINIGIDIRGRFYPERKKAQYDYGLHIGVNF
ncbi:MAG TPA: hypothetical protein VIN07_13460 [Flavipsychrobacter sp.]